MSKPVYYSDVLQNYSEGTDPDSELLQRLLVHREREKQAMPNGFPGSPIGNSMPLRQPATLAGYLRR